MKILIPSLLSFLFVSTVAHSNNSQWVEWIIDAEASYALTNNLNYSAFDNDEREDYKFNITGVFGRFYQLNSQTRLHALVELNAQKYQDFDLLNSISTAADIGIRYKFGVGHNIPYLQLKMKYQSTSVESSRWDNDLLQTSIELGKHFSDSFSVAGNFEFNSKDGVPWTAIVPELSNQVFDQNYWRASIFADYIIEENWLVSLSYTRRDGDFASACTAENIEKVWLTEQVKAITSDDVFGGCIYRLDGTSNSYSSSLSFAVNNHSAIHLFYEINQGQAKTLRYQSTHLQLSYNYRY